MSGRIGGLVRRLYGSRDPGVATPGDARMLRTVRWRLVAWSGAITLAVLLVLGAALYLTTAQSLAAASQGPLQQRARTIGDLLNRLSNRPELFANRPEFGFAFGGTASGTLAVVVTPSNDLILPGGINYSNLPIDPSLTAARDAGSMDTRAADLGSVPVRVVSEPVDLAWGRYVVQVIGDRTSEQQTLSTLLVVLLVGGLAAVALAIAAGWLYASRALVPIRDSLRRQREFAADASHELRTPLTVLRASVEDLRRHPEQPVAAVGTALEDMTAEVDHMTDLVEGLLLLARADSGVLELQREPVDLADAAAAALGELTPVAEEHEVRLALDAQPTLIMGDFGRLRQLAVILVDNAIRHAGGAADVRVAVHLEGAHAILQVDDTGHGIRPEDRKRVFERFWRAPDAPAGGLGLGLAIASWIAERHGGTVTAGESPSGGARFEVRLPVSA
jgi:two-component system, OmpR family, sensor histidine kinase CiaH